jgi:[ribosomal protein S18]-alanine N-acetyltransferase
VTFTRLTSAEGLDGVLALDELCFHRPWTRGDYERELADPNRCFIYLAVVEGATIAYCSFWRIFDEIHVNNFAVHPAWRRRGIGKALLAFVVGEAASLGAPFATLEVRASNLAAVAMYERAGFRRAGLRRAYYTHPVEDALILWRGDGAPHLSPPST